MIRYGPMGITKIIADHIIFSPASRHAASISAKTTHHFFEQKGLQPQLFDQHPVPKHGTMQILYLPYDKAKDTYLLVHGRGAGIGSGAKMAEELRKKTQANICLINYPGAQGNQGQTNQLSAVAAIQEAIRFLIKVKKIDPNNIHIAASSMGANLTAVALGLLTQAQKDIQLGELHFISPPHLKLHKAAKIRSRYLITALEYLYRGRLLETVCPLDAIKLCEYISAQFATVHHAVHDRVVPYPSAQAFFLALLRSPYLKGRTRLIPHAGSEHHRLGEQILQQLARTS